jgi:hypothetical protein
MFSSLLLASGRQSWIARATKQVMRQKPVGADGMMANRPKYPEQHVDKPDCRLTCSRLAEVA